MKPISRISIAYAALVALATFTAGAIAQVPDRVIYGVLPPADGEDNNPNRDIGPDYEYQVKPMYENLIGVDPNTGEWVPMLAESWELNEAGDELTFKLRKGVQFHNGFGEMTAADVVFSIQDLIDPVGAVSGVAEAIRRSVEEFEIVDDHTLVFHVGPDLDLGFFEGVSYGAAGTAIKSKADWDSRGGGKPASPALDEAPIAGTGPWQFVSRTPGRNVVFKKVPYDHWRQNADFEELEYRFIQEEATRLSALLAGEIHITSFATKDLTEDAAARGMKIIRSSLPGNRFGLSLSGCYFVEDWQAGKRSAEVFVSGQRRYPDSPWCDKDLRLAVSKAIDRQALIDAFFDGEGEVAKQWFWIPEQQESWNPEWDARFDDHLGYDPDEARAILAAHGKPVSVQIFADGDVPEAIGNMLSEVGFEVELVSMDNGTFNATQRSRTFTNMIQYDYYTSEIITSLRPANYGNQRSGRAVENVEWDTLYEDVRKELNDPARRDQLWRELGDIYFEEVPAIPLYRVYLQYIVNPKVVCGYTYPGSNMSDLYAFTETLKKC